MRKVVWFWVWSDWCGAGLGALIWMTWHLICLNVIFIKRKKVFTWNALLLSISSSVLPIRKCQLSISLSNSQSFGIYFWDGSLVSFTSISSPSLSSFYPKLYTIYHLIPKALLDTKIWTPIHMESRKYKINGFLVMRHTLPTSTTF